MKLVQHRFHYKLAGVLGSNAQAAPFTDIIAAERDSMKKLLEGDHQEQTGIHGGERRKAQLGGDHFCSQRS